MNTPPLADSHNLTTCGIRVQTSPRKDLPQYMDIIFTHPEIPHASHTKPTRLNAKQAQDLGEHLATAMGSTIYRTLQAQSQETCLIM